LLDGPRSGGRTGTFGGADAAGLGRAWELAESAGYALKARPDWVPAHNPRPPPRP